MRVVPLTSSSACRVSDTSYRNARWWGRYMGDVQGTMHIIG